MSRPASLAVRFGALVAALVLLAGLAGPARAAQTRWGTPTAEAAYGASVTFTQPVTLPSDAARVEVLLSLPGVQGPFVSEVRVAPGATELSYAYDAATSGLLPNTPIEARWRVTLTDGSVEIGPPAKVTYEDTRYPWRTKTGSLVRIHWYEGDDAFATRALRIAENGVKKAADMLGVAETEPIDFYVYADSDGFCSVYGSSGCENVGGFAPTQPDIRTLFALIPPDEIDTSWVGVVIPHELTHLVFDTAVSNPYHYPPRWLNEGFADYLSQGFPASYRAELAAGIADGTLLPLESLGEAFPSAGLQSRFFLSYAESVSAVKHIIDTYGKASLVRVIRAYKDGVSDDEAFTAGIGKTFAEFEAEWLASIKAAMPRRWGPQSPPPGPVPSAWAVSGASPAPATPGASVSAAPSETGTPVVAASQGPTPSPSAGEATGGPGTPLVIVLLAAVVAVIVAVALAIRHERTPPPPPPPAMPAAPHAWPPPADLPPLSGLTPPPAPPQGPDSSPPAPAIEAALPPPSYRAPSRPTVVWHPEPGPGMAVAPAPQDEEAGPVDGDARPPTAPPGDAPPSDGESVP